MCCYRGLTSIKVSHFNRAGLWYFIAKSSDVMCCYRDEGQTPVSRILAFCAQAKIQARPQSITSKIVNIGEEQGTGNHNNPD